MPRREDWPRWAFGALAALGVLLFGVAAGVASEACSGVCEDGRGGWFETPGSWERWGQLFAATLVAVPLVWAALAAFRGRVAEAPARAAVAIVPLIAWVVLMTGA